MAVLSVEELTAEGSAAEMRVDGEVYAAAVDLPGGYNLYNAAAAVAAATALGVAAESAVGSLARLESGFGRLERFALGDARAALSLFVLAPSLPFMALAAVFKGYFSPASGWARG